MRHHVRVLVLKSGIFEEQAPVDTCRGCTFGVYFPLDFVLKDALKDAIDFGWGDGFIPERLLGEFDFCYFIGAIFAN